MRLIRRLRSRGGYAMVYVVVAMTLMLAVVGGITATAARNLQTQQSAVSMMVDRYKAAGEVEAKFAEIAKIESKTIESTESKFSTEFKNIFASFCKINDSNEFTAEEESGSFTATIEGGSDNTTITAGVLVRYTVTSTGEPVPAANPPEDPNCTYTVTVTSVEYQFYNVEYKGAGT